MDPMEAIEHVSRLKGLFPRITTQEEDYWADRFERFESEHVSAAIDRYADKRSDTIDRPSLLEMIYAEQRRGNLNNRERIIREAAAVAAEWEEIDSVIGSLSDDEMENLKTESLSKMNEDSKALLASKDARKSKTLKALIYKRLNGVPA